MCESTPYTEAENPPRALLNQLESRFADPEPGPDGKRHFSDETKMIGIQIVEMVRKLGLPVGDFYKKHNINYGHIKRWRPVRKKPLQAIGKMEVCAPGEEAIALEIKWHQSKAFSRICKNGSTRGRPTGKEKQQREDLLLDAKREWLEERFIELLPLPTVNQFPSEYAMVLARGVYRIHKALCLDPYKFFRKYGITERMIQYALRALEIDVDE